jgi:site-specific recombinase XerD
VSLSVPGQALGPHHFAFYRGLINGLPGRELAARYLPLLRLDERLVRAESRRIRQVLCAAARRNGRTLIANMLEAGPPRLPETDAPLLEEFSSRYPEGFYSESELLELFAQEYPQANAGRRLEQVRKRQLGGLRWIEALVTQPVGPQDDVRAWLPRLPAERLAAAGLTTLARLVDAIERQGAPWHRKVSGIGAAKASAIVDWLRNNVPEFEARIGSRALVPVRRGRAELIAARGRSRGVVPFEAIALPSSLATGNNKVPPGSPGSMTAFDDVDAIRRWLLSKLTAEQLAHPGLIHRIPTYRAYRKEAERLLLWAIAKGKSLGAINEADAVDYTGFISNPQPAATWVDAQRHPRWSTHWKPFAGPVTGSSRRYALVVVEALFAFLVEQRYLFRNPWKAALRIEPVPRSRVRSRVLTLAQCGAVRDAVGALPSGESKARIRALLSLAYTAGLRRSELAGATWGDLRLETVGGESSWFLEVRGKGAKVRDVSVEGEVLRDLLAYAQVRGLGDEQSGIPGQAPLLTALPSPFAGSRPTAPLSESAVGQVLKEVFGAAAALSEDPGDQAQLEKASAHWLRHSLARHALDAGAELTDIQAVLGHASPATTSLYLDVSLAKLRRAQRVQSSALV